MAPGARSFLYGRPSAVLLIGVWRDFAAILCRGRINDCEEDIRPAAQELLPVLLWFRLVFASTAIRGSTLWKKLATGLTKQYDDHEKQRTQLFRRSDQG